MKKIIFALSMTFILCTASGCEKITDTIDLYLKSPEERLAGYVEDVAEIIIDADNCDVAAKEIDLYTETHKDKLKRDIQELLDQAEKDGTKDETMAKIKKNMSEVKTRAENSKCISDGDVIMSLAGFSGTVAKILVGSALGALGSSLMGDDDEK